MAGSFRLIVFDLDGTLIDSRRDIADAANALLESSGADRLPDDRIAAMVGEGAATLVARAFAASGRDLPPGALDRFLELYRSRLLAHTRPYAGIPEVLGVLSKRAPLGLLTNKPLAATREILHGLGLWNYFFSSETVVGGDGPFPRKPDPSGLHHIRTVAGIEVHATVLVGDSPIDWRTARAAQTAICLARYGFGFQGFPAGAIEAADRVIDQPAELLSL